MNRFFVPSIMFSLLVACAPPGQIDRPAGSNDKLTAAGHDQGNGADYVVGFGDESAWFTGAQKTIRFCVQSAPNFGVSPEALEEKVKKAFAQWRDYMKKKRVDSFDPPQTVMASKCDGTQDIRFLFGVSDQHVKINRAKFKTPVAIAIRTATEENGAWSKGLIWVAGHGAYPLRDGSSLPDWSQSERLDTILLHEIGHVHGVGHVEGTIMTKDIARHTLSIATKPLQKIDDMFELTTCESCTEGRVGTLGLVAEQTQSQGSKVTTYKMDGRPENFKRLMGREATGTIFSEVQGSTETGLKLVVSDTIGKNSFDIRLIPNSRVVSMSTPIFTAYKEDRPGIQIAKSSGHNSTIWRAGLVTAMGEQLDVSVVTNQAVGVSEFAKFGEAPGDDGRGSPVLFGIAINDQTGIRLLFSEEKLYK